MESAQAVKKARALKPQSRVRLCAPSYPTTPERLRQAAAWLRRKAGFRVSAAPNAKLTHGYLAGSDSSRAESLNQAFRDPRLDAIFSVRGGYGAMRLLDRLDFEALARHPKLLIGYSDFTAVLLAAYRHARLIGLHGPMPAVEFVGAGADASFEALERAWQSKPLGAMPCQGGSVLRPGTGRGPLLGGCLSLLAHLAGTGFLPDLSGAILFWEEIGEPPYRIDRMLTQLRLGGHLSRLAGMLVGGLTDCGPHNDRPYLEIPRLLLEILDGTDYPVVMGLPFGHVPCPITLPVGAACRLEAQENAFAWTIEEAATLA